MQQQETIRIQLSTVLQAVISQILVKRIPKGRCAIHDIMVNTPSIAALIRDNKTFRIPSDQQTGQKYGMVTMDDMLFNKYAEGLVSREDCQDKSQDYNGMLLRLKEYDEEQAALQAEMGLTPMLLLPVPLELRHHPARLKNLRIHHGSHPNQSALEFDCPKAIG